jgi:YdjC-like protein
MRVVVNADDFGLSEDTVQATIDAIEAGYVTSATLMPCMPASEQAVAFALRNPQVSFGVHLTFVGDGEERPVSAPHEVPSLVDASGRLHATNRVRLAAVAGRLPVAELEREIVAQVDWFRSRGMDVSHVDSHRHLHKYAPFREALARALPPLGISRVRNVQDVYLRKPLVSPTVWFGRRWRADLMRRFRTTDHFYMPASAGDTSWVDVLGRVPDGATLEIGVHPGRREEWRVAEQSGAEAFVEAAGPAHLVSWREI